jgi:hypothetical protein
MARLVIDLPENSPGCILLSGPGGGCPLPLGSAPPPVRGQFALSACEPELERHVNTRAGVYRAILTRCTRM